MGLWERLKRICTSLGQWAEPITSVEHAIGLGRRQSKGLETHKLVQGMLKGARMGINFACHDKH